MTWIDTFPVLYSRNHLTDNGEFMKANDAMGDGLDFASSSSLPRGWRPL